MEKTSIIPAGFSVHKTLKKIFDLRNQSIERESSIDWATAESLAFGTLLAEGFSVRLSGQDREEELLVKDMLF